MIRTGIKVGRTAYLSSGYEVAVTRFALDHSVCLMLIARDGSVGARASVCLSAPDLARAGITGPLPDNQTAIKTWAENEGVLEALEKAAVIAPTERVVPLGGHGAEAVIAIIAPRVMKYAAKIPENV